jgi:hypothetical protein
MPNLQSFSLLKQRVVKYKSDYELEQIGEAFDWVALETILDLNSFEIESAIVDDGMDGGIDAVYISNRDVHIFTFNYATTFENCSNNFPQNKLDNLSITVQKILQRAVGEDDVNPALWEKIVEIWELFNSGHLNFHFQVCSNKEKPTDAAKRRFEDDLTPFRLVDFEYWDLEDLVRKLLQEYHRPVDGVLKFIDRSHFQKSDGYLKATVAAISAIDLINLGERSQ